MPEVVQQHPLSNEELAAYHGQVATARQSEHPEQRDTYVRPNDAWAHEASEEYIAHRIRHASENEEDLVAASSSGEHKLSVDGLSADFERLSIFMREDVRALSSAIADPASVRDRWWAAYDAARGGGGYGWRPPKPRGSTDMLSLEEAKLFLEDRETIAPNDETDALHTVSLRATTALLESWKNKQYAGDRTMPEDSAVELYMDVPTLVVDESKPVGEQTYWSKKPSSLAEHMTARREKTEAGFRSIHREHISKLGRAAADAAGVRKLLEVEAGSGEDPELAGLSRRDQQDVLRDREISRIMHDPDAVKAVMSRASKAFNARIYEPRKANHAADPSEWATKQLELAEGQKQDFRLLHRFINRWRSSVEAGSESGFGEYMSEAARRHAAELEQYLGKKIPDDVGRRMDEFEGAHRAYSGGESYSFSNTLRTQAYQYAVNQLD